MAESFFAQVYALVQRVPRGRVITYGAVAAILGQPCAARQVGWAMADPHKPESRRRTPAHRVINARGQLSGADAFGGYERHRALLEREGVTFLPDGRVDLDRHLWLPARNAKKIRPRPDGDEA